MREKNQNTNFYIIYRAQRLYWWAMMLVCVCICVIWYWCSPVPMCNWIAFAVGVHVVCLQLLWTLESMWHVATCFVMFSKSFLYNSFSSSSSTAAGIPGDFDVIQPRPPKPPIRLSVSDVLGRRAGLPSPLVKKTQPPESFRARGGWWHLGSTCLFILFLWSNPKPNTSNTDGIHGR